MKWLLILTAIFFLPVLSGQAQPDRIITLSGAISETVHALGYGNRIVAVDVTSEYPAAILSKPRVSQDRTVALEGLLVFKPDLILAPDGDLSPNVVRQLKQLGVKLITFRQEYSPRGTQRFIREVAAAIGVPEKGKELAERSGREVAQALSERKLSSAKPRVLFIYAQGVGAMSVAGKGSQIDAIIELSGGRNAVQEFNDFKPYSTEALVKANPDVILMFDFGLASLGGPKSLLRMPGVSLTNAGKNNRIITMNGPLLSNFSVRLPEAIRELNKALYQLSEVSYQKSEG